MATAARADDAVAYVARQLSQLVATDLRERRADLAQRLSRRRSARTPWDDVVASVVAHGASA